MVSGFDDVAGLGEVVGDDGGRWPFHCTAVTDGSRHVPEGARVRFRLHAGVAGRWEAGEVEPLPE